MRLIFLLLHPISFLTALLFILAIFVPRIAGSKSFLVNFLQKFHVPLDAEFEKASVVVENCVARLGTGKKQLANAFVQPESPMHPVFMKTYQSSLAQDTRNKKKDDDGKEKKNGSRFNALSKGFAETKKFFGKVRKDFRAVAAIIGEAANGVDRTEKLRYAVGQFLGDTGPIIKQYTLLKCNQPDEAVEEGKADGEQKKGNEEAERGKGKSLLKSSSFLLANASQFFGDIRNSIELAMCMYKGECTPAQTDKLCVQLEAIVEPNFWPNFAKLPDKNEVDGNNEKKMMKNKEVKIVGSPPSGNNESPSRRAKRQIIILLIIFGPLLIVFFLIYVLAG